MIAAESFAGLLLAARCASRRGSRQAQAPPDAPANAEAAPRPRRRATTIPIATSTARSPTSW